MLSGVGWERVLRVCVGDGARVGSPYVVYTLEFPCLRLRRSWRVDDARVVL